MTMPSSPSSLITADHRDLAVRLASVPTDDAEECGLAEITSPAFVVRSGTKVVAAAGYRRWPGQAAHLCVLTMPEHRGRGLAGVVASAAVAHGLANQLSPQCRLVRNRRVEWRGRWDPASSVCN